MNLYWLSNLPDKQTEPLQWTLLLQHIIISNCIKHCERKWDIWNNSSSTETQQQVSVFRFNQPFFMVAAVRWQEWDMAEHPPISHPHSLVHLPTHHHSLIHPPNHPSLTHSLVHSLTDPHTLTNSLTSRQVAERFIANEDEWKLGSLCEHKRWC